MRVARTQNIISAVTRREYRNHELFDVCRVRAFIKLLTQFQCSQNDRFALVTIPESTERISSLVHQMERVENTGTCVAMCCVREGR